MFFQFAPLAQQFLIHYGWRGTTEDPTPHGKIFAFLIHYGWRGTGCGLLGPFRFLWFLIHYGWRGTNNRYILNIRTREVSNPLRLEGDPPDCRTPRRRCNGF